MQVWKTIISTVSLILMVANLSVFALHATDSKVVSPDVGDEIQQSKIKMGNVAQFSFDENTTVHGKSAFIPIASKSIWGSWGKSKKHNHSEKDRLFHERKDTIIIKAMKHSKATLSEQKYDELGTIGN